MRKVFFTRSIRWDSAARRTRTMVIPCPGSGRCWSGSPTCKGCTSVRSIFHLYLNPTGTGTIPATTAKSTAAWARTRTLPRSAVRCTQMASAWCSTGCSTMWGVASGPFRMCWHTGRAHATGIGFTSTSAATPATMTACGTRDGRATLSL